MCRQSRSSSSSCAWRCFLLPSWQVPRTQRPAQVTSGTAVVRQDGPRRTLAGPNSAPVSPRIARTDERSMEWPHGVLHANQSLPDCCVDGIGRIWQCNRSNFSLDARLVADLARSTELSERTNVDRIPAFGATPAGGNNFSVGNSTTAVNAKVEAATTAAHQATDRIADTATGQVDRLAGATHRAVNSAADAATSAAQWASAVPEQVKQAQTRLTEATCASIRAKPLQSVAGALVVGYLLGRLARL